MRELLILECESAGGGMWGSETPGVLKAGGGNEGPPEKPKGCPLPGPVGKFLCWIAGEAAVDIVIDWWNDNRPKPPGPAFTTDERAGIPKEGTVPAPGGGYYFR
jgi:hypothetical protein